MTEFLLIVAVIAIVTMLTRFLPFFVFGEKRETPSIITYLGEVLPYAIMGMLVVFCLKEVSFTEYAFGLPEIVSCCVVVLLHVWKRNTLLSIGVGTLCYMIIVQVFV